MDLRDLITLQTRMMDCLNYLCEDLLEGSLADPNFLRRLIPDIERLKDEMQTHYEDIFRMKAQIFWENAQRTLFLIDQLFGYEGAEALKPLVSWWALWSIDLEKATKGVPLRDLLDRPPSMEGRWPAYRTEDLLVKDVKELMKAAVKALQEDQLARDVSAGAGGAGGAARMELGALAGTYALLAAELPRRCLRFAPALTESMKLALGAMTDPVCMDIPAIKAFKTLLETVLAKLPKPADAPPQQTPLTPMWGTVFTGASGGSGAGSHALLPVE